MKTLTGLMLTAFAFQVFGQADPFKSINDTTNAVIGGSCVIMVVGFALTGLLIYFVFRWIIGMQKRAAKDVLTSMQDNRAVSSAVEELNKRLARGEINEAQYQNLRATMERNMGR